jgi:hypothetical protein
MSPKRRWYYQHLEREREKHRKYQKGYQDVHREYYRQYSSNYYREYKERLMSKKKPEVKTKKGLPEHLNSDGVKLLMAAVIDQCRQDIKRWEKHIARGGVITKYKDVSYDNYLSAKYYLEKELPMWQEFYSQKF